MCRAQVVSDVHTLPGELEHLKKVFKQNGYRPQGTAWALSKPGTKKMIESSEKKQSLAMIPYHGAMSARIGCLMGIFGIKTIFHPPLKIQCYLHSIKGDLGLRVPGMYKISCSRGLCYTGQTGCTIIKHGKMHQRYIYVDYTEKSILAKHCITTGQETFC